MSDLVCVIHNPNNRDNDKLAVFEINDLLNKTLVDYFTQTYGKTAKVCNDLIGFVIGLTLKEYTNNLFVLRFHLILPTYYNFIEGKLYLDVSREESTRMTPFKYIKNGLKIKNMKKNDSILVKVFTNIDFSLINNDVFIVEDDTYKNISSIYHKHFHFLDNVLEQYLSMENLFLTRKVVIGEREKINELIKNDIYNFIKTSNLDLKKTVVRIDKGENINSTSFTYGSEPENYYFFNENGEMYHKKSQTINLFTV